MNKKLHIAFFGTPDRAVMALEQMAEAGIVPALIVTQPDRPQGRKLVMTPPPVKTWAIAHNTPVLQPENLADEAFLKSLRDGNFDAFVVVAYGKILKKALLDIPRRGCLNLHASLLPRLRGSCPIETAILTDDRHTGATIMLMDEFMDHGPIIAQKVAELPVWPLPADDLARIIVNDGGKLLAEVLPKWIDGSINAVEQNHAQATTTKKIKKEDGLIDLSADAYQNFLTFNAYKGWPSSFFFANVNGVKTRVIITNAIIENDAFVIRRAVLEGKKEMSWNEIAPLIS
jgi:methionyl-tRNA formyltransferase